MFIDCVKFKVAAGNGGAGCAGFRREKFIPLGGPDGGDGGDGGDVYVLVSNNTHTLANFKGKKFLHAQNGEDGKNKKQSGKKGENLVLIVPAGTAIYDDESGEILLDMIKDGEKKLLLRGAKGGLGNAHFKNSINQAPTYCQKGQKGQSLNVRLELKLIADVGLVGFPNVGKSTLISMISNAKPEIANYEFTTITPKLGFVEFDSLNGFVMADIPGIIEGASNGKGLGIEFLKHIKRNKILLFMIDGTNFRSLSKQYRSLREELENFSSELAKKYFAIAITKSDAFELSQVQEFMDEFGFEKEQKLSEFGEIDASKPLFVMPISSVTNRNIAELKAKLFETINFVKI